jgi:hypothetical protein
VKGVVISPYKNMSGTVRGGVCAFAGLMLSCKVGLTQVKKAVLNQAVFRFSGLQPLDKFVSCHKDALSFVTRMRVCINTDEAIQLFGIRGGSGNYACSMVKSVEAGLEGTATALRKLIVEEDGLSKTETMTKEEVVELVNRNLAELDNFKFLRVEANIGKAFCA